MLLPAIVCAKDATGPVLVVGDSLSAAHNIPVESGWVALLDKRLHQQLRTPPAVVNASISGENSAGALTRLPALLQKQALGGGHRTRW